MTGRDIAERDITGRTLLQVYARCDVDHEDRDPCWLWRGSCSANGYPLFQVRRLRPDGTVHRSMKGARRETWALDGRPLLAEGQYLSMRCGHVKCLNPGHMLVVSRLTYMAKRRGPRPADDAMRARLGRRKARDVKLDAATARQVRARIDAGELQKDIAASLNVSRSLVSLIKRHRLWRETTPFSI